MVQQVSTRTEKIFSTFCTIKMILTFMQNRISLQVIMFLEIFNFVGTSLICYQFYHIFGKFQNYFFYILFLFNEYALTMTV